MILPALIWVLLLGGLAAWIFGYWRINAPRWVALGALVVEALLLIMQTLQTEHIGMLPTDLNSAWLADFDRPWIPRFGIGLHLAMDGLSLVLLGLTVLLGFIAVSGSWTEINNRRGLYYLNLLMCLAGVVGVFLAVDLFLLFFFWELMIIPMYFLISLWGHENRQYAAIRFFIFTQVGSLPMLASIVALALIYHSRSRAYTFDYFDLLDMPVDPQLAYWLMLGFFFAFAVKLPAVVLHVWLPDAHTQAPTGGSVILAGVMLKTGAYGMLRFVVPLFPGAAHEFAPVAMALGTIGVLYAAALAYAQSDLKRLIAYTSVSHMGFVLLGVFSWNLTGLLGSVITMLAHGISAGALFMIAGALQQRLHTRDMGKMGGLWPALPKLSALTLFFALATLGLPGLGNFIGEFLVLQGAFGVNGVLTAAAALVLILSPVYALAMMQKTFYGSPSGRVSYDADRREWATLGVLALAALWLGLHPHALLEVSEPALKQEMQNTFVLERE